MTNKEQIHRDMAVALDFVAQIIENPDLTDKIPESSARTFLDEENKKTERQTDEKTVKKYVRVKRHFEVI